MSGAQQGRKRKNARSQTTSGVSVYRAQEGRRRPIVPQGCPCSIVGAGGLNDRVRDGNGCVPSAIVTSPPAHTDAGKYANGETSELAIELLSRRLSCAGGSATSYCPTGLPLQYRWGWRA